MTDITDLVHVCWTSSDGAFGAYFFALCHLFTILEKCFDILQLKVCFDIITVLRLPST